MLRSLQRAAVATTSSITQNPWHLNTPLSYSSKPTHFSELDPKKPTASTADAVFDQQDRLRLLAADDKNPSLDVGPGGRSLFTFAPSLSHLTRHHASTYFNFTKEEEGLKAVLPEGLPMGMVKEFQDSMRNALLIRQSFLDLRDNFRRVVDPPMWFADSEGYMGERRHVRRFARFVRRFGKQYDTEEEMMRRFEIFSESLKLIRSTNRKQLSYKLGVNQFADWTWEEFKRNRLGAAQNCSATLKGSHKMTDAVLPEQKDWRKEGIVSPVKDQGHCGSCWTFRAS